MNSGLLTCSRLTEIRGSAKNPLLCKAACPPDHAKLALRKWTCDGNGEDAYCCKGYKPSDIPNIRPPERPEPPEKSAKVLEFEEALVS